jgi:hypothetical protein
VVDDERLLRRFLDLANAKYDASMDLAFLDPAVNATVRVDPRVVIGLDDDAFGDTPTRWDLDQR